MSLATASLPRPGPLDGLRPPSSDNPRVGLTASLVAHVLLVTALALGVHWRSVEPDAGLQAELWAATPQLAAPPQPVADPAPPPAPPRVRAEPPPAAQRDADIATEKARQAEAKRKAEQEAEQARRKKAEQAEAERKKAEQVAKEEKAAEAQREKLRQQQMQRLNAQLGGPAGTGSPGSTGTAAHDAGPSASYAGRIKARILPNIVLTEEIQGNPTAEVEVTVAADGSIIGRRITKPSGVKAWDETVLRAIDKTGTLPRDTDGRVQPRMVLAFRPRE